MNCLWSGLRLARPRITNVHAWSRPQCVSGSRVYTRLPGFRTKSQARSPGQRRRRRYNIRKLLSWLQARGSPTDLSTSERAWLRERGYEEADVSQWLSLSSTSSVEEALHLVNPRTPVYLLLQVLRKSTWSRDTYNKLISLFQSSVSRLDDDSWYVGFSALARLALRIDPVLLKLLEPLLPQIPQTFSNYTFNRCLKVLAAAKTRHPETSAMQIAIVREMTSRGIHLSQQGYEALLFEAVKNEARYADVYRQMASAGYNMRGPAHRLHENKRRRPTVIHRHPALLDKLQSSTSLSEAIKHVEEFGGDFSDHRIWALLLGEEKYVPDSVRFCLRLITNGTIQLTPKLLPLLFQSCRSPLLMPLVGEICTLAISKGISFDVAIWIEYLKRLIWARRITEVFAILTQEPGGNSFLDMTPDMRRDPQIWSSALQQMNLQVKRGHWTSTRHAKYMGEIRKAIDRFEISITRSLLWCLLESALLSGPRQWAGKHSCDCVVSYFYKTVDLGTQPWKIPGDAKLWTQYMKVLVANEEFVQLSDAMERMVSGGTLPDERQLKLFALGVWESGNIEAVQHWQTYFDGQENMETIWPSTDEVFKYRQALGRQEFRWFYE